MVAGLTWVAFCGSALADSFTPVQLGITIAPTAYRDVPLPITVKLTADAGALDSAATLWRRVKLARECAGTWTGTPGTVLLNKALSPQPATGKPYSASLTGSGGRAAAAYRLSACGSRSRVTTACSPRARSSRSTCG